MRTATVRGNIWGIQMRVKYINVAIKCSADEMAGENEGETGWIMGSQSKFKGSG